MSRPPRPARLNHRSRVEFHARDTLATVRYGTTSNLSPRGLCIRSEEAPEVGSRLVVRVEFASSTLELEGRVTWSSAGSLNDPFTSMFGVDIVRSSAVWVAAVRNAMTAARLVEAPLVRAREEAQALELFLVELDEDGPKPRARRVREKLDVLMTLKGGKAVAGTTIDLSATGLAMFTEEPQPIGTVLVLEVALPDGTQLHLGARTARVRRTPMRDARLHLMGVALIERNDAWDRYLETLRPDAAPEAANYASVA